MRVDLGAEGYDDLLVWMCGALSRSRLEHSVGVG